MSVLPPKDRRQRKTTTVVFRDETGTIFVPTEDMRLFHEQSKPAAISARAGLSPRCWDNWKLKHQEREPWLFEWLYGASVPERSEGGFVPTVSMRAFRKHARVKGPRGIASAAVRSAFQMSAGRQRRYGNCVSERMVRYWLREHGSHDWFPQWLLRGQMPPNVTVATRDQVERVRTATDYITHCKTAGITALNTYVQWLKRRMIPSFGWLLWLYGGMVPVGGFVVVPFLQNLRAEMSRTGICRAIGTTLPSLLQWEQDPLKRMVLEEAMRTANQIGPRSDVTPAWPDAVADVYESVKKNAWEYAKAATLSECCKRAGGSVQDFHTLMATATRLVVAEELRQYLNQQEAYQKKLRAYGLVAKNFFVPSAAMLAFREAAAKEMTRQKIWDLRTLPGFFAWFHAWTTPRQKHGNRYAFFDFSPMQAEKGAASCSPRADAMPSANSGEPAARAKDLNDYPMRINSVSEDVVMKVEIVPGGFAGSDNWVPVADAVKWAAERRRNITINEILKRKNIRTRPHVGAGLSRRDVELGSLAQRLLEEPSWGKDSGEDYVSEESIAENIQQASAERRKQRPLD
jgi:hypothetical protein